MNANERHEHELAKARRERDRFWSLARNRKTEASQLRDLVRANESMTADLASDVLALGSFDESVPGTRELLDLLEELSS